LLHLFCPFEHKIEQCQGYSQFDEDLFHFLVYIDKENTMENHLLILLNYLIYKLIFFQVEKRNDENFIDLIK
jgi:hypothetical protein